MAQNKHAYVFHVVSSVYFHSLNAVQSFKVSEALKISLAMGSLIHTSAYLQGPDSSPICTTCNP